MFGLDLALKLTKKSILQVILVSSPLLFEITAGPIFIGTTKNAFLIIKKMGHVWARTCPKITLQIDSSSLFGDNVYILTDINHTYWLKLR